LGGQLFFRITQYNVDAHTHTQPYEYLWRIEHMADLEIPKSPLTPHYRREHRLPLNA
jgi:hypothetical protein